MDKHSPEQRRRNMQAVKSSGSKIEQLVAKELWRRGHRYRKNNKTIFGKPDLSFKKLRIAVFIDGDFWHGKDWERKKHEIKSNKKFWHTKIERNIVRDSEVNQKLKSEGWTVLRFWGSDVKKDHIACVNAIEKVIREKRSF